MYSACVLLHWCQGDGRGMECTDSIAIAERVMGNRVRGMSLFRYFTHAHFFFLGSPLRETILTCGCSLSIMMTRLKRYLSLVGDWAGTGKKLMILHGVEDMAKIATATLPLYQVSEYAQTLLHCHSPPYEDEKILLFWDLSSGKPTSPPPSPPTRSPSPNARPVAAPFAASYGHPLHSVCSHPSTSKELVVSDSQGSIFVVDWRVDEEPLDAQPYRGLSVAQLIDCRALADARTGMQTVWGGSVDWHRHEVNM